MAFSTAQGQIRPEVQPWCLLLQSTRFVLLLRRMLADYQPPPKSLPVMVPLLTFHFNSPLYDSTLVLLPKAKCVTFALYRKIKIFLK